MRNRKKRSATAKRQAKIRAERDAKGLCRTCGRRKVAISKKTGRKARQCTRHLRLDSERKGIVALYTDTKPAKPYRPRRSGGTNETGELLWLDE